MEAEGYIMSIICANCSKSIEGEGVAFCPYCGEKLPVKMTAVNEESEKWIQKALGIHSYPERKKILQQGLEACPGSREIEWELLFVGEEPRKKTWGLDFSIIKSWILEIYLKPEAFSEEKKDQMRFQFFDDPKLKACLNRFDNPADKQREYLQRLCREYVELFLEGSNQIMGNFLGIRIERNKEKRVAVPVAEMINRIRTDEKLSPEQREQLWKAMYQGYASYANGKTQYLDERLNQ